MSATVKDLTDTLKGSVSRELMAREGRRLGAKKQPEETEELTSGQTIHPKAPGHEFENEDSAKEEFEKEFGS